MSAALVAPNPFARDTQKAIVESLAALSIHHQGALPSDPFSSMGAPASGPGVGSESVDVDSNNRWARRLGETQLDRENVAEVSVGEQ